MSTDYNEIMGTNTQFVCVLVDVVNVSNIHNN